MSTTVESDLVSTDGAVNEALVRSAARVAVALEHLTAASNELHAASDAFTGEPRLARMIGFLYGTVYQSLAVVMVVSERFKKHVQPMPKAINDPS